MSDQCYQEGKGVPPMSKRRVESHQAVKLGANREPMDPAQEVGMHHLLQALLGGGPVLRTPRRGTAVRI